MNSSSTIISKDDDVWWWILRQWWSRTETWRSLSRFPCLLQSAKNFLQPATLYSKVGSLADFSWCGYNCNFQLSTGVFFEQLMLELICVLCELSLDDICASLMYKTNYCFLQFSCCISLRWSKRAANCWWPAKLSTDGWWLSGWQMLWADVMLVPVTHAWGVHLSAWILSLPCMRTWTIVSLHTCVYKYCISAWVCQQCFHTILI